MTADNVEEVKKKIAKIKEEQLVLPYKKRTGSPIIDIASELVAGAIVGVIMGILLDKLFNSKPLFLIICIILASIATFRSIWKKYT
ncbi:MAG: AtpZ/AtpI family protein [Rickettsiaceae bacterium]|nr:AtpZ/AtpI family protein [Rickettsiaceae bacterium]MCP5378114.1 AtpZ/AtpI family protein [Rickettsiaceae bacterium]